MPRIRYLKPEFFSDEDLAELPFETRLTFAGLWCFADKAGRLEDRPKFLKAMIFPYDDINIEEQLDKLNKGKRENGIPFIQRYESNGLKLIQIVKWDKHQIPHHREKESIFPSAPSLKEMGMGMGMGKMLTVDGKAKQGKAQAKQGKAQAKQGKAQANELTDDEFILKLKENPAYKDIDIDCELGKLDAWLMTPRGKGKKKTRQRIVNWLNRVEKPIQINQIPPTDPMDRRMWEIEQIRKKDGNI